MNKLDQAIEDVEELKVFHEKNKKALSSLDTILKLAKKQASNTIVVNNSNREAIQNFFGQGKRGRKF